MMLTKKNSSKQQRRDAAIKQLQSKLSRMNITTTNKQPKKKKVVKAMERNSYAMCRLRPLQSMGRTEGIPDGSSARRLLIDHRNFTTITFGSTGIVTIALTPSIPSPIWVYPIDVTTLINGTAMTANTGFGFWFPVPVSEWMQQAITYNNLQGNFDEVNPLYASAKFRLVTAGWAISYTGTSLTDSGVMRITSSSVSLGPPTPNMDTFTVVSSTSGTNTTYSTGQVMVRDINGLPQAPLAIPNTTFFSSDSKVIPLKRGAHGVLRHVNNTYPYQILYGDATFIGSAAEERNSFLANQIPTPTIVASSGVCQGFDETWDTTFVTITGGTAGQSFVLDTMYCIEYCPSYASNTYSLTKQGPPSSLALLQSVENRARSLPLAEIGSALKTAVEIGSTVASVML